MRSSVPTYRLYGEDSKSSSDFWIHCETLAVRTHLHNWEIAPHRHDAFFQLFLIERGAGTIIGIERRWEFSAPCVLFVPPGEVHGFSWSRDAAGLVVTAIAERLSSAALADREMAAFAAETRVVGLEADDRDADFARACLVQIHHELENPRAARPMMLEPLTVATLVSLMRAAGVEGPAQGERPARDRRRIEELESLLALHFREQRPVAFYAERLGLSPTHLNRLARSATGHSVQQLVALRVIEAARRELVFTANPVQQVAYGLGFSDPAYFNRFFRRRTGVTPGAYRSAERSRMAG